MGKEESSGMTSTLAAAICTINSVKRGCAAMCQEADDSRAVVFGTLLGCQYIINNIKERYVIDPLTDEDMDISLRILHDMMDRRKGKL